MVAVAASTGVLAACGGDFDREQAEVDARETYDLFTAAVFAGDGPVACGLMTMILKEETFTVGPDMVTPMGGSCEGRMGQQGMVIREDNGGTDPSATLEDLELNLVAEDAGSQPFAPGGIEGWIDAESVVGDERQPIRLFLINEEWLIGSLPEPFLPDPVLGGSETEPSAEQ